MGSRKHGSLGLGKNLGLPQHDFNHFLKCSGKCIYLGGVFGHFEALIGAPGVKDAQHGLHGCG